jgi:xanthine dehydrogenase accessory factor
MLVYPDGSFIGSGGGGEVENRVIANALEALREGGPRMLEYSMLDPSRGDPGICGGQLEIFVEPIVPPPLLVVIGSGHVGKEVARLGRWLGFRVAVSDDRPGFCTPGAVPDADMYYPVSIVELPQRLEIDSRTWLVLTTRGLDVDVLGLPALLDSEAAYIGVIGSRRRWAATRSKLLEAGVSPEKLDRVHSPIGLRINAETAAEIALSIMAEIVMLRAAADFDQPVTTQPLAGSLPPAEG